jgi:hypothetical protein
MKTAADQLNAELSERLAIAELASRLARKTGSAEWHRIAIAACGDVARLTAALARLEERDPSGSVTLAECL